MNASVLMKMTSEANSEEQLFVSLINGKGKILSANAIMNREFDVPRKARDCFFSLLHPNDVEKFKAHLEQNEDCQHPLELQLRNHVYHKMRWHINQLESCEQLGELFLCFGVKAVPTGKRVQKEAIEFESIVNSYLDKTPNLSWVMDLEANLVLASRTFLNFFHLDEKQVIRENLGKHLPVDFTESLQRHCQVLASGNKSMEIVEKIKWVDGSTFFFHINLFTIGSPHGKMLVGCNAVDMTEKYRVQEKLEDTNERFLLLSRATTDAIWEWDMQTGHIFRNDTLMEMVGYQHEVGKGLSWWLRRIHPEDRNMVSDTIKEATDLGRQSWQHQYRFRFADGEYKHVQDRGYIVYENGLPIRMIGSLQDMSEQKAMEHKWESEKLVLQKELSETVIRAQEQERTRIGYELHDNVNQILSTTKLFVEMLKPVTKEEKSIKEKSIDYLKMAIDEIRKLSRELVVPQLKEKTLVDSIQSLIEDIELSGGIKIKFTHDVENGLLPAGKKITLFRILQEQLKNIIKHSQAKQVDIFLQCRGVIAELVVNDDGIGFDPHQAFKGIGLSNIRERAKFYNGTAEVQTAPGKGCTLVIKIPVGQ